MGYHAILERAAPAASDDPTLAAIASIRAALTAVIVEDLAAGAKCVEPIDAGPAADADPAGPAPAATRKDGPFGHGTIRLHGRP